MSANRSVQAAQRRRAGPVSEPGIPGRGPQPSINSAQMFANQARPGSGPNMPTGRLAGQQAVMQQQQQSDMQKNDKLSSVNKMTIPQAITLITLRLGAIESKLLHSGDMEFSGESGIDAGFLQSIMARLEEVEKRPNSTTNTISNLNTNTNSEINLLKQQMETIKQAVLQLKNSSITLVKENTALKTQVENMKKELTETRELVSTLQNLTMDNSQKILDLSMGSKLEYGCDFDESNIDNFTQLSNVVEQENFTDLQYDGEQNEIIGTDLKQQIENELNSNMLHLGL